MFDNAFLQAVINLRRVNGGRFVTCAAGSIRRVLVRAELMPKIVIDAIEIVC